MDVQPEKKIADNLFKKIWQKKSSRLIVIVLVAVIGVGSVLVILGTIKIPSNPLTILQNRVQVKLQKEYKNPFSKDAQYVNPFDTYKNPFVVGR